MNISAKYADEPSSIDDAAALDAALHPRKGKPHHLAALVMGIIAILALALAAHSTQEAKQLRQDVDALIALNALQSPRVNVIDTLHTRVQVIEDKTKNIYNDGFEEVIVSSSHQMESVQGRLFRGSFFRGSGEWPTRRKLAKGRSDFSAASATNGTIYMVGGLDQHGQVLNTLTAYDPLTQATIDLEAMPEPRYRAGVALAHGHIYVTGGFREVDGSPSKKTFVYDINERLWSEGPEALMKRGDCCMAAVNSTLVVLGGYDEHWNFLSSTEILETNTPGSPAWVAGPSMNTPRGDVMCASAMGSVYAFGGYYDPTGTWDPNSFLRSAEKLSVGQGHHGPQGVGEWSYIRDMIRPRGDGVAVTMEEMEMGDHANCHILLVGGEQHAHGETTQIPMHEVEIYDIMTDTWTQKAPLPTGRFRCAGALSPDGSVIIMGGHQICHNSFYLGDNNVSCHEHALDTVEVFMDTNHAPLYYYYGDAPIPGEHGFGETITPMPE